MARKRQPSGRRITNRRIRQFNKILKEVEKPVVPHVASNISRSPRRYGGSSFDSKARRMYDRLWNNLNRKARKWANTAVAEFKSIVPYDTGNLSEAIEVLDYSADKKTGHIRVRVGVNSKKVATAPPRIRRSTKRGIMVRLPDYDYSPFVLGHKASDVLTGAGFSPLARKAARAIGRGRVAGKNTTYRDKYGDETTYKNYADISTWFNMARRSAKKIIGGK